MTTAGGVWLVAIATAAAAVADDVMKCREPHWLRLSHVTTAAPHQVYYVNNHVTSTSLPSSVILVQQFISILVFIQFSNNHFSS